MIIVLCQVFEMNPYLWVGLPGLAADIQTVRQYSNLFPTLLLYLNQNPGKAEDWVPDEHVRAEGKSTDEAQNLCKHGSFKVASLFFAIVVDWVGGATMSSSCLQVSNMLYEKRFGPFFVEPIVAGLDPVTFKPYICNMVTY